MDLRNHLPNARMACGATHEVARSWCSAAAQMAHCFVAFREPLPRLGALQATAVAQSVACRHVAAFDGFGRLAVCSVQARPDVDSPRAGGRHRLDVRLMAIGDHLVGDDPARSIAWRKKACALAVSRCSRSRMSTTAPSSSMARYK